MDKNQRMKYLVEEIEKHNRNYYVLDNPTISDAEYDKLYYELVDLEKELGTILPNSPTQRVGGETLSGFKKKEHEVRLYSLNKVRSSEELKKWMQDMKDVSPETKFTLEYKFDGLQLVIEYENGLYKSATTRGNGLVGEDVTEQVRTIRSVPLKIQHTGKLIVQGEGMMTNKSFEKYNKTALEPLKNARNGVAGAIRNLDPKETAKRMLDFFCYSILSCEDKDFKTQVEMHDFLKENGFNVGNYFKVLETSDEVEQEIKKVDKIKSSLDIMIDGMVIKINNTKDRKLVGYTNKFPKWAMAFKFEAVELSTELKDVVWQVGRTGKVTPIAVLEPVELAGAMVKRATLNNIEDIERKKVKIGSRIFVRRSNEVIPEVLGLAEDLPGSKEIEEPKHCPCCRSDLVKKGPISYCRNYFHCKDQVVARLVHFVSRDAMNIEGLSEKTIEEMYEKLHICEVSDLYNLKKEDLLTLEKFGDKKAQNIIDAIEKSKKVEFSKFIYSLGILEVGVKTARDLSKEFSSIDDLMDAKSHQLEKIHDIGKVTAKNILEYFADENNTKQINKVLDIGVVIDYSKKKSQDNTIFSGKKVVITGTIEGLSRNEASEKIIDMGGRISSSVSPKTDLVIVGDEPGSKLEKAKNFGIKIMPSEEFLKIIQEK